MSKLLNIDANPNANDRLLARLLKAGVSSVSLFYCALLEREEIKGRPCAGVDHDVHAAYRDWCAGLGIRPCALPHFVGTLQKQHGVTSKRLRHAIDGTRAGPHRVLVLSTNDNTLAAQVEAFRRLALKSPDCGLGSPSRFYFALKRGEIRGMPKCPALSCDVYDCYRVWCARAGERAVAMSHFINALNRKHCVTNARWRYFDEFNVEHGPHGILMLGDEDLPPGDDRSKWLGKHIARFRMALNVMRGGLFDA